MFLEVRVGFLWVLCGISRLGPFLFVLLGFLECGEGVWGWVRFWKGVFDRD